MPQGYAVYPALATLRICFRQLLIESETAAWNQLQTQTQEQPQRQDVAGCATGPHSPHGVYATENVLQLKKEAKKKKRVKGEAK